MQWTTTSSEVAADRAVAPRWQSGRRAFGEGDAGGATGTEVHKGQRGTAGDITGTVAYRVKDGKGRGDRLGILVDVDPASPAKLSGRVIKHICVNASDFPP